MEKMKGKTGCKKMQNSKVRIEYEIVKRTYEKNKFNQWSEERPEKFFHNSGTKSKDENNDLHNDGYKDRHMIKGTYLFQKKKGKKSKNIHN